MYALCPSSLDLRLGPSSPAGPTSSNLLGLLFPGSANASHIGVGCMSVMKNKNAFVGSSNLGEFFLYYVQWWLIFFPFLQAPQGTVINGAALHPVAPQTPGKGQILL